jgi:hypothetical protein
MKQDSVNTSIALLLMLLISAALIGWLAYSEQGTVTETVQVGTEGIQKAQEVKQLLEDTSRTNQQNAD